MRCMGAQYYARRGVPLAVIQHIGRWGSATVLKYVEQALEGRASWAPVVAAEAQTLRRPLQDHYAHLLVHGALHALGHDHETSDADADAMEALETSILARLGFGDPYR